MSKLAILFLVLALSFAVVTAVNMDDYLFEDGDADYPRIPEEMNCPIVDTPRCPHGSSWKYSSTQQWCYDRRRSERVCPMSKAEVDKRRFKRENPDMYQSAPRGTPHCPQGADYVNGRCFCRYQFTWESELNRCVHQREAHEIPRGRCDPRRGLVFRGRCMCRHRSERYLHGKCRRRSTTRDFGIGEWRSP